MTCILEYSRLFITIILYSFSRFSFEIVSKGHLYILHQIYKVDASKLYIPLSATRRGNTRSKLFSILAAYVKNGQYFLKSCMPQNHFLLHFTFAICNSKFESSLILGFYNINVCYWKIIRIVSCSTFYLIYQLTRKFAIL